MKYDLIHDLLASMCKKLNMEWFCICDVFDTVVILQEQEVTEPFLDDSHFLHHKKLV